MGVAVAYDEFEDPGMGFGEDEIRGFVSAGVAEARVKHLIACVEVIERYLQIPGAAKEQWWRKAQSKMIDTCTWYCQVAGLPGIDRSAVCDIPAADTDEGKRLTRLAQTMPPAEDWLEQWGSEVMQCMVHFVTISRRCASASTISVWTKAKKKEANRIANAIKRELDVVSMLSDLLRSLTK